jgi:hypothetical protein
VTVGVRTGSLGRPFTFLWAAYAVSTLGTTLAFNAFGVLAILVLHAGPAAVSLLAAAGPAAGALLAVPLGPWVEPRRKRPVMITMDLTRFAALASIPLAYALGGLGYAQLLVVSVVVAAADITFQAASGACLKSLVAPGDLLVANGRLEATTWTATALGPPLGGAAIGLFGPMTAVLADAVSYVLSAAGIRAIGPTPPATTRAPAPRPAELLDGWRFILAHPALRALFANTVLVNGLIMAPAPLLAVLMLGELGFAPWEYGLAFAAPCLGGLLGARLSRRVVARYGTGAVLRVAGTLRACWPVLLTFVGPGAGGLALVIAVQFALVTCIGVFNPVYATFRLAHLPADRVARTLTAWQVTTRASVAALTAAWGLLAAVVGPRAAIAAAGAALLATPLLLRRVFRDGPGTPPT